MVNEVTGREAICTDGAAAQPSLRRETRSNRRRLASLEQEINQR